MIKTNRVLTTLLLLGMFFLGACNAQPKSTPSSTSQAPTSQAFALNTLDENEVSDSAKAEIEKITGQDANVFWHIIQGDNVFSVDYITKYDPKKAPKEFIDEFNQVTLHSAKWFAQGKTNSPMMILFAELVNSPVSKENPPLREVVVEKQKAIAWLNGSITKDKFIDSWLVVPLPNQ